MNDNGKTLTPEQQKTVASTRRFDLRRILGALFVLYGVIVFVVGLVATGDKELRMTGGIHINLWTGAAMFVLGLLFFLWDRLSPVPAEDILKSEELEEEQEQAEKSEGLISD
jgi:membrane-bound ClpP family serine protease